MIVLDTSVLSALMQPEADLSVVAWLDLQPSESVWTTAVSVFEIRFGVELLAPGRRRRQLEDALSHAFAGDLQGRILPFDEDAALVSASLAAHRRTAGKTVHFRDIEIAGIVSSRRATLATRNTRHFADLGIELLDPWGPARVKPVDLRALHG